MCDIFIKDLRTMCGEVCGGNVTDLLIVKIYVNNTDTSLNWFTNESYTLKVEKTGNFIAQIILFKLFLSSSTLSRQWL